MRITPKHQLYENNTTANTAVKSDCNMVVMCNQYGFWARCRMHSHAQIKWTHDFCSCSLSSSLSHSIFFSRLSIAIGWYSTHAVPHKRIATHTLLCAPGPCRNSEKWTDAIALLVRTQPDESAFCLFRRLLSLLCLCAMRLYVSLPPPFSLRPAVYSRTQYEFSV